MTYMYRKCYGLMYIKFYVLTDSKASEKLSALLTKVKLSKDIAKLSPVYKTSLESFHSVVIHFGTQINSIFISGNAVQVNLSLNTYYNLSAHAYHVHTSLSLSLICVYIYIHLHLNNTSMCFQVTAGCFTFQ